MFSLIKVYKRNQTFLGINCLSFKETINSEILNSKYYNYG